MSQGGRGRGWAGGEGNAAWRADILPIHMHSVFVYPSPQSSLTALVSHNLSGQCLCIPPTPLTQLYDDLGVGLLQEGPRGRAMGT